jgi:hypothetical protein
LATSKWWKEERHGVFLDYNQNAKDRTTCSAYSVRPMPDARVSAPLAWREVPDCNPADFTLFTMPKRFAEMGDPHAGMDAASGSLEGLLELRARDAADGIQDAPWPGEFRHGGSRVKTEARAKPKQAQHEPATKPVATKPRSRAKAALLVVAKSADREAALAELQRWLHAHADVAAHLTVEDILVDSMRGRSTNWTRVRVNLRHVPEEMRPTQAKLGSDPPAAKR